MNRGSGLLLHISSLPSPYGIGDLGPEAYAFVDFLVSAKQQYWQILPLNPTDPDFDNSPYRSLSALAFNPLLISIDLLVKEGLLDAVDISGVSVINNGQVNFETVIAFKDQLFRKAFKKFILSGNENDLHQFCAKNSYWLDDYALFKALRDHFNHLIWYDWPVEIRERESNAILKLSHLLKEEIAYQKFLQYIFFKQWQALRKYCRQKAISIIGDIPIYVALDSVDIWTHPDLFKLDDNRRPLKVAGVPPDYFSATGQLWGNPVYNWDMMEKNNFTWWMHRLRHNLNLFDIVRIDHFRGLVAYWEVAADEETALNGEWIKAPADAFLTHVQNEFEDLPIIAEDLGLITSDVVEIMEKFELPGMRVLQFAFSGDLSENEHIPENLIENSFLFTGTHDNNTTVGWFLSDTTLEERHNMEEYFKHQLTVTEIQWQFIETALASVANTVIIPVQDLLGLDEAHRMNRPFINEGNWLWQLKADQLKAVPVEHLINMVYKYRR